MLRESFYYPFNGESRFQPILITAVLFTVSVLVLPFILVVGYLMTVLEQAGESDTPPEYSDWKTLGRKGLQGSSVVILHVLVPVVLFAIAGLLVNPELSAETEPTIVDIIALGFALLSLISYLGIHYVTPAALVAVSKSGEIRSAFNHRLLYQVCRSFEYAKGMFIVFAVLQFFGALILVAFIFVTGGFGALITPFFYAFLTIQISYVVGDSYVSALRV